MALTNRDKGVLTVPRDKRAFTRITLDIPGSITLYQTESYHTGLISNISLSGCFFPSDSELPVGERCDVTITTGEGLETKKVTVIGMIVRNDSEGAGISFTDNSTECRQQLDKIISRKRQNNDLSATTKNAMPIQTRLLLVLLLSFVLDLEPTLH